MNDLVDSGTDIVPLDAGRLSAALEQLVKDDRVARVERDGVAQYGSELCVIPFESPAGWEAAVFDHPDREKAQSETSPTRSDSRRSISIDTGACRASSGSGTGRLRQ